MTNIILHNTKIIFTIIDYVRYDDVSITFLSCMKIFYLAALYAYLLTWNLARGAGGGNIEEPPNLLVPGQLCKD